MTDRGSEIESKEARAGHPSLPDVAFAAVMLGAGSAVAFGVLGEEIQDQEPVAVDTGASQFLHGFSNSTLDAAMTLASFLGSAWFVIPVLALVVIFLLRRRRLYEAFYLSSLYATSGALNFLLKQVFHRARPQLPWASGPQDFSFPSGHSMNSTSFYIGLALVAWLVLGRRAGLIALVGGVAMVLLVGLSRVYFGYHYVSDVLGGYSAGLLWVIVWAVASRAGWNRFVNRQRHTVGATPG